MKPTTSLVYAPRSQTWRGTWTHASQSSYSATPLPLPGELERVTAAWRNHTFHSLTEHDLSSGTPLPPTSLFAFDE